MDTYNVEVNWTGERMRNAGLLYQNYENLAEVSLEGKKIGTILELQDGTYQARVPGIMEPKKYRLIANATDRVVEMHKKYRS